MFPAEYTLLELEVYTISAQCFSVELTFNLFDELVDGVAENEVSLESRVSMQVQVHKHPLLFPIMLA